MVDEPISGGQPAESFGGNLTHRDKMLALAGTLAAVLMAGLDQTIVATAGPEIQRDLAIPAALYAWITTAYLVASTVTLPIYGKLSDLYGRRPILFVGVGLFLFGSLACGFAPTTGYLIAARVVQGLGAGSLFTTTLALIADLFPPRERGKYMGLIGAVMGISSVVGPIAGGFITDAFGWHWVFFINLPIGAGAIWMISTHMPRIGGQAGRQIRIDYAGVFWLIAAVVPMMVALSLGGSGGGWGSPAVLGMLAFSVVAVAVFLRVERKAAEPIIDLALFHGNPTVGRATLTMLVLGATFLFTVIFLPLYLVNVAGFSATKAGLSLTPLTFGMVATSVLSGQLASRLGSVKGLLIAALGLMAAAFLIMGLTLTPDSSSGEITWKVILIGLGMGPTFPLYTLLVQNAAPPNQVGVVTSGSIFARSVGQVLGLALFGTLFAATLTSSFDSRTQGILGGLAEAPRAVVTDALSANEGQGTGGEGRRVGFDAAGVSTRVAETYERSAAAGSTGSSTNVGGGERPASGGDRESALAAVDRIDGAFDESLAQAVARMYLVGAALVLVALILTISIPTSGVVGRRSRSFE